MKEEYKKGIETQEIIYFIWGDAVRNNKWQTLDETTVWVRNINWNVHEVGFLVEENEKYLVVASAFTPENKDTDLQFNGLLKVPRGWIKIIKRIKITI